MKFGPVPVHEAEGDILAHSIKLNGRVLKKGMLLDKRAIELLVAGGFENVIVARLQRGDCLENEAARRIAKVLKGTGCRIEKPFTGRCNLFAKHDGLLCLDVDRIHALNRIDAVLSVATLNPFAKVSGDQMVATVKIIPFALNEKILRQVDSLLTGKQTLHVAPFEPRVYGLVSTFFDETPEKILDKTSKVLRQRLESCGSKLGEEIRVPHSVEGVVQGLDTLLEKHDGIILFGASAIADMNDIIPTAIRVSGGVVDYFGMPVDPGNLLLIGKLDARPVIGAPGCARSPKENGFDWVLHRIQAGVSVSAEDIQAMGVGGLLKEIPSRPQPRGQPTRRS